jgi:starvation-inducible outer membrane lipoprotein
MLKNHQNNEGGKMANCTFFAFLACILLSSAGCTTAPKSIDTSKIIEAQRSLAKVDLIAQHDISRMTSRQATTTGGKAAAAGQAQNQNLDEAFAKMLEACQDALGGFAAKADNLANWQIGKLALRPWAR